MAFTFKLVQEDGTPADPPMLKTAVPTWRTGDTMPLGGDRILRVVETPAGEPGADEERWEDYLADDEPPELVFYCADCDEREFGPY